MAHLHFCPCLSTWCAHPSGAGLGPCALEPSTLPGAWSVGKTQVLTECRRFLESRAQPSSISGEKQKPESRPLTKHQGWSGGGAAKPWQAIPRRLVGERLQMSGPPGEKAGDKVPLPHQIGCLWDFQWSWPLAWGGNCGAHVGQRENT